MAKNRNDRRRKDARRKAARLRNKVSDHEKQGQSSGITRKVVEDDLMLQGLTGGGN
jgi:hypothetical protein